MRRELNPKEILKMASFCLLLGLAFFSIEFFWTKLKVGYYLNPLISLTYFIIFFILACLGRIYTLALKIILKKNQNLSLVLLSGFLC